MYCSLKMLCRCVFASVLVFGASVLGEEWPTFRHDNARSGLTRERLRPPLTRNGCSDRRFLPPADGPITGATWTE